MLPWSFGISIQPMKTTAFLFPGQGSQFVGMGQSLAAAFPAALQVFENADRALGFPLSTLCFEGPEADLKLTQNTQPALLTVSIAAMAVLQEKGIEPDFVAGHSLGEYSALVAAGSLRFSDAVELVRKRGHLHAGSRAGRRRGHGRPAQAARRQARRSAAPGGAGRSRLGCQPQLSGPGSYRRARRRGRRGPWSWPKRRGPSAPSCCR